MVRNEIEPIRADGRTHENARQSLQHAIGHLLQCHYRDLVATPLPEDLQILIARLGGRERTDL